MVESNLLTLLLATEVPEHLADLPDRVARGEISTAAANALVDAWVEESLIEAGLPVPPTKGRG